MSTGWVGFDLDMTTAIYTGWKGELHIGAPVPAIVERIRRILARGVPVRIFTARVSDPDPEARFAIAQQIRDWSLEHIGVALESTCIKDYDCLAIFDDRAFHVVPNTGEVVGPVPEYLQ